MSLDGDLAVVGSDERSDASEVIDCVIAHTNPVLLVATGQAFSIEPKFHTNYS